MGVDYSTENKLAMPDTGTPNWGSIFNSVVSSLDAGAFVSLTFGETIAAEEAVCLNSLDGKVYKSASHDPTLTPTIGFAPNAVTSGNVGLVQWFGWIDVDTSFSYGASVSWSPGDCVYSDSVAGRIAKVAHSWANRVGTAKGHTNASWVTRVLVNPANQCRQLVSSLICSGAIAFDKVHDNGDVTGTHTIDWNNGNKQRVVLTGNTVFTFANPPGPCNTILEIIQDGVGSRLPTFTGGGTTIQWAAGAAPTFTTTADGIDIVAWYWNGIAYKGSSLLAFA